MPLDVNLDLRHFPDAPGPNARQRDGHAPIGDAARFHPHSCLALTVSLFTFKGRTVMIMRRGQRIAKELIDVPKEFDTLDDAIAYMAQHNPLVTRAILIHS